MTAMRQVRLGRLRLLWSPAPRPRRFFYYWPEDKKATRFVDVLRLRLWIDGAR